MTDKEELYLIARDYKGCKKAELLRAIKWLLDYIEDMELPSAETVRLRKVVREHIRHPFKLWLKRLFL